MRDLLTVAEFTIKEAVKRKSFIISNIVIIAIIILGFNVPNIINSFSGEDTDDKTKILIIDEENIFGSELITLNGEEKDYTYTMSKQDFAQEEIKQKLDSEEIDSCIRFKKEEEKIKIDYIVKSLMMGEIIPQSLIESFKTQYTATQIEKAGLTQEQLQAMFTEFEVNSIQTDEDAGSGNVFVIMMLSIVLFLAIYYCAYQVSTSITTEKTSKIMETLVTSTSPRAIVLGKTIGIGIVGLVQVLVISVVAIISANAFLPEGALDSIFDMSNMTVSLGIITLVYFILGYFTYSFLYALTGSMVSKPEDIQSANGPVAIIVVIGFYLAYFSMMNPTSSVNKFAAIFPFSAPFCMPFRILMGSANLTEIVISIAVLVITILIIAKVSIKIYSSAILNTGTKMSINNIIKMYKSNDN